MEKGKGYFQEIVLSEREAPHGCGTASFICLQTQLQVCLLREGPVSYIPEIFLNSGGSFCLSRPYSSIWYIW